MHLGVSVGICTVHSHWNEFQSNVFDIYCLYIYVKILMTFWFLHLICSISFQPFTRTMSDTWIGSYAFSFVYFSFGIFLDRVVCERKPIALSYISRISYRLSKLKSQPPVLLWKREVPRGLQGCSNNYFRYCSSRNNKKRLTAFSSITLCWSQYQIFYS